MGRIPGYFEWDDDDLTPGQKKEGGLHQNLFDEDGKLKGSARFIPSDEDFSDPLVVTEKVYVPVEERRKSKEQQELEDTIAELTTALILNGITKAKPHVQHWWRESFQPFVKRQWSSLRRNEPSVKSSVAVPVEEIGQESVQESSSAFALQDVERPRMSSAEAQARMLAAIAAQAFSDEQMRLVNSSEIVDEDDVDSVREAISKMPPEIVAELVKRMVTNPSMFEEKALAELASVLARQSTSAELQRNTQTLDEGSS
ncbi:hypothetical protein J433_00610 [Corynebacterium glutamicum MT]|uniref:Uncharacterized protein n=1 Tax=Corynebacterium glutamicum TaxID=1718 RepID=A0AB36I8U2_CORGT|nr:hypothetical protein [Corynebacterium glutamicum]AGN18562.1 hypothetical protein C624_04875 [Corynebacterium glutamicum SCgG1]AGN21585.1 hypothetical protein C629_04875 [Corynebacterium glutamicum SCgG2]EGV39368.1 hypothetical protein CgS9114_12916 [Corynebacterium glutamicum S9114]EOA66200.1 hypothetical protein J433_00610 [Corynebacterium glutamicum MT]EPP41312.1 hypothetical protein A583_04388 [Corynebacterium glutamicum Z188]